MDVEKVFSESIDNYLKREPIDSLSKGDIEKLINDSIEKRTLDTGAIEKLVIAQIEPLTASLAELETYTQNQFKAVREELKKATRDRTVEATDAIAISTTTPANTAPMSGEYISFPQLAKQLGYPIPEGIKATNPRKEGADELIAFAATLGQSYGWDGKKQKFYKV